MEKYRIEKKNTLFIPQWGKFKISQVAQFFFNIYNDCILE